MLAGWLSAILWVIAIVVAALVIFASQAGQADVISRLARRARWLGLRRVPDWLANPAADRWAALGTVAFVVLVVSVSVVNWVRAPLTSEPSTVQAPALGDQNATLSLQPDRFVDEELKKFIEANVPKTKRVSFLILGGETPRERVKFADQISEYLKSAGYEIVSPYRYFLFAGDTPEGLDLFPDEKNPDVWVMRIGLNTRK